MKVYATLIRLSEWVLIAVMAFCGTFALTKAGAYVWLEKEILAHIPAIGYFLPVVIWALVFTFGVQSVILRKKGGETLTELVVIISLPSLLSFNAIDLLKIFGTEMKISTGLSFSNALCLGLVIMICYVLLSSVGILKRSRAGFIQRKVIAEDIETVDAKSHIFLLAAAGAALLATIIIALFSRGVEVLFSDKISQVPWYAVFVGLGCILILAVYLYWLGTKKNK